MTTIETRPIGPAASTPLQRVRQSLESQRVVEPRRHGRLRPRSARRRLGRAARPDRRPAALPGRRAPGVRRRARRHGVHAGHAARVRRRPHRRHRQHHPQADGRRASARCRSASGSPSATPAIVFGLCLLLALGVRALAGQVENDRSTLHHTTGADRHRRLRRLPLPDRDPQPGRAGRHRARCSGRCGSGALRRGRARGAAEQPRLHEPDPRRRHQGGHQAVADVPDRPAVRARASTPRPRSRCSSWPAAPRRSPCPGTRS